MPPLIVMRNLHASSDSLDNPCLSLQASQYGVHYLLNSGTFTLCEGLKLFVLNSIVRTFHTDAG